LWQEFAFRTEAEIDRAAAKRRAMAYLRSVFPSQILCFAERRRRHRRRPAPGGWVYASDRLFAIERESLFQDSWQVAADQVQIPGREIFSVSELGVERALIVRDAAGGKCVRFRNSCSERRNA